MNPEVKKYLYYINRVIHGYDKIDDEIAWGTIVRHLPVLKSKTDKLLSE